MVGPVHGKLSDGQAPAFQDDDLIDRLDLPARVLKHLVDLLSYLLTPACPAWCQWEPQYCDRIR